MRIAQRLNAGKAVVSATLVPEGRLTLNRPYGTATLFISANPALKRRAMIAASRWDVKTILRVFVTLLVTLYFSLFAPTITVASTSLRRQGASGWRTQLLAP